MNNYNPAIIVSAGTGKEITVGTAKLFLKLSGSAVANKFSVTEYELTPGFPGPPPHIHKIYEHAWYVLDGSITVQLENEISVLSNGSFIFIPKMTVHAFANNSDAIVRLLVIDMPGGFENYYDDLQAAFGDGKEIDQQIVKDIQLKYDTYPAGHKF